jgi:hypothetical protein
VDLDHDIGRISGNVTTLDPGTNTLTVLGIRGIQLPSGATADRVNSNGIIRNNTTTGYVEAYSNGTWVSIGAAASGPLDGLTDVTITSPAANQVLGFNGTEWTNNAVSPTSYSTDISSWTLISGNQYYADVTHNLGTQSIAVSFVNLANNEFIAPGKVVVTNTNSIRVTVTGNTRTLRCTVLANGVAIAATTANAVTVKSGGVNTVNTPHSALNFTGAGVTVVDSGSGTATIDISPPVSTTPLRTFSYYSSSMESPNNANWAVNALAPSVADPTNSALLVRQFSNTVEQGVGCMVTVPPTATNVTFRFKGRPLTAPGAAAVVQPKLYIRSIPNGAAVGAWSAATNFTNIAIPTNAFFQYSSQSFTIAALGLAVNGLYQLELTRSTTVTGGTQLASNWLLAEFTIEFT